MQFCETNEPGYAHDWLANGKVHIFWEGHKSLQNLTLTFDYSTYLQSKVRGRPSQNIWTLNLGCQFILEGPITNYVSRALLI